MIEEERLTEWGDWMTTEEGTRIIEQEERIAELEKENKELMEIICCGSLRDNQALVIIRPLHLMPLGDFKQWAKWIKEINHGFNIVTIPKEAEVVTVKEGV